MLLVEKFYVENLINTETLLIRETNSLKMNILTSIYKI
jgi:hypothetical protein